MSSSWRSFRSHRFHFIFYDPLCVCIKSFFPPYSLFFAFSVVCNLFLFLIPVGFIFAWLFSCHIFPTLFPKPPFQVKMFYMPAK